MIKQPAQVTLLIEQGFNSALTPKSKLITNVGDMLLYSQMLDWLCQRKGKYNHYMELSLVGHSSSQETWNIDTILIQLQFCLKNEKQHE